MTHPGKAPIALVPTVLLAVVAGCSEWSGEPEPEGPHQWQLVELERFGTEEGDDPLMLSRIRDLVRDGDRLYVADAVSGSSGRVFSLGLTEENLAEVGRRGEGPGEYRAPSRLQVMGDTLWALDSSASSALAFVDGETVRSIDIPMRDGRARAQPQGMTVRGDMLVGYSRAVPEILQGLATSTPLVRMDRSGRVGDTVFTLPFVPEDYWQAGGGLGFNPLQQRTLTSPLGDGAMLIAVDRPAWREGAERTYTVRAVPLDGGLTLTALVAASDSPPRDTLVEAGGVEEAGHVHPSDTVDITRAVIDSLVDYAYQTQPDPMPDGRCLGDRGVECFGGDPDVRPCPPDVPCHPVWKLVSMLDWLRASAREHPEAGFVVGYTAYALTRFGSQDEALEVARECRATKWWCAFVEAHVWHARGDLGRAEELFRAGLGEAPDSIRTAFTDMDWIVGRDARRRLDEVPAEERASALERLWWLTDPLFAVGGNDRWVEHLNRVLTTRLLLIQAYQGTGSSVDDRMTASHMSRSLHDRHWSRRVRRGVWDSWNRLARTRPDGVGFNFFTSTSAARYHFVPDFENGDLERPVWRLHAELDDEGYTPPYGTFHELPSQFARFRTADADRDSMRVAVAGTLSGTEMAGATAEPHLVFSDAPGSFPVHLTSEIMDDRAAFLADSPAKRYVLSFEVLGNEQFARHRVILEPLRTEGLGVSDVLLYRPDGDEPPGTVEEAAELMLGEAAVRRGEPFGVYWETYGAAAGAPVEIEIAIEEEGRGLFSRLRGLLPGGGQGPVRLSWSEPSPSEVFPRGVEVEPGDLDRGSYTLLVRVAWEGREPFELRRGFEVR